MILPQVTKRKLSQSGSMNTAMSSVFFSGLQSHQIQQSTFGVVAEGESHSVKGKSAVIMWRQGGPKCQRNVSNTL